MKTFPYHTLSPEIFRNSPETRGSILGFSGHRIGTFSRRDSGIKGSGGGKYERVTGLQHWSTVKQMTCGFLFGLVRSTQEQ